MQIRLHILKKQVQILVILSLDDSFKLYDVWVVKLMQDGDLSICSLSIDIVLKRVKYFFESICYFSRLFDNFPYMSIGTTTQKLLDFEKFLNMFLNFFGHIFKWKTSYI